MKLSETQEQLAIGISGWAVLLLIVGAMVISGCATKSDKPTADDTIKAGIMDGAIAAAKAPLFKLTCPTTGCILGSLEIGNPSGAAQMAEVVKIAMTPQPSEASQNYRATLGFLGGVSQAGFIAYGVKSVVNGFVSGFDANGKIAGDGFKANGEIASLIPQTVAPNVTNTNTYTLSGTGALNVGSGTASFIGPRNCVGGAGQAGAGASGTATVPGIPGAPASGGPASC